MSADIAAAAEAWSDAKRALEAFDRSWNTVDWQLVGDDES